LLKPKNNYYRFQASATK